MPYSQPHEPCPALTPWGWLVLLVKATVIAFRLLAKAVEALVSGRRNGLAFHRYIGYAGIRDFQQGLDAIGVQNLRPSTSKTCERFARKYGIEQSKIQLPDGTIAQWLGPRNAAKLVLLLHGGGYMSPALKEHLSLAFGFTKPPHQDFSAVVLQYDLASENVNHYPRQLQQAVALLDHLLYREEFSPSAITLIGDSAGAHLLLSLLLHIGQSNPLVKPLKVDGHFSGAILISPWVFMDTSAESMRTNKEKDTLTVSALQYWTANFLGDAVPDDWNTPFTTPSEWLRDLPVDEILVLYGDHELLRDDTSMFCNRIKAHHPRATTLKFSGEVHSQMILNRFLKIRGLSESEKVFIRWMNAHLRS